MNSTIKKYIKKNIPESGFDFNGGKYNLRFELGGELENGTKERVEQAIQRATEIYRQAIGIEELLIVIENYQESHFDSQNKNKEYLFTLLDSNKYEIIKGPFEQTYYEEDEQGRKNEKISDEQLECDIAIGIDKLSLNTARQIIEGIANLEMGFDPCITQVVDFFSINRKVGFRIYDDRGCDVWANDKEMLRPLYNNLNEWILDYNRPEIDKYLN